MHQYIITYLGGDQPSDPDEGRKNFAQYQAWLASLGKAVINPMVPFKNTHTIKPDGSVVRGSEMQVTGHTIIQAESIDQAIALTKACPFLAINGSLEVAEVVQM